MRILDPKFKKNLHQYVFQCALATFTILIILTIFDVLAQTAIIASLGATAFIIFTMPKSYSAKARSVIGGYSVGIFVGCLFRTIATSKIIVSLFVTPRPAYVFFAALAVGSAIFLMVVTNTEHPPAAGMALGLVLNPWTMSTIIFIPTAIIVMVVIRKVMKPVLINLL